MQGSLSGGLGDWPQTSATVGGGIEFTSVLTNVTIQADLGADSVTLSYENTSSFPDVTIGASTFVFTDLDWANVVGTVVGLTELSSNFGSSFTLSTGPNSLQIDAPQQNTNPGDVFSATFQIETTHRIIEPGTFGVLLIGLTGLVIVRRHRDSA